LALRSLEEVDRELAGPGGPFETVLERVGDADLRVFKNRARDLRRILEASLRHGDRELFVFDGGRRLTFRQHFAAVATLARKLRDEHGIGRGDRVALLGANSAEWIVGAWASVSLGAIAVGMNGWWTEDEIHYGLGLCEPRLLLADHPRLARLGGRNPGVPVLRMERDLESIWSDAGPAELPAGEIDEDDPAFILFTSGTTGRPKGAISTHRNLIAFMDMMQFTNLRPWLQSGAALDAPRPQTVSIASGPLFHVSGLQSCALAGPYAGTKYVWTQGRYDPERVFELTLAEGVNRWGGVPTQLFRLLEHPSFEKYDFSQVRAIGGGGSVFSPELQRLLRQKLPHLTAAFSVGYGSTECGGLATIATNEMLEKHPDCVGRALPTVELAIKDDAGRDLGDGTDGNICVRGAMVMPGYWRNPEASAEAILPGGWLVTGDIGQLRDGLLFLASRKRDMIIRGGENVYPVEIENRLDEHPGVLESAVIGVDHRTLGQEVKAIVVARPGALLEAQALRDWVAGALAYYKVPTHVEIRSEALPRNATGKVLKHVLAGAANPFVEG